jgi:hypothetical protein
MLEAVAESATGLAPWGLIILALLLDSIGGQTPREQLPSKGF